MGTLGAVVFTKWAHDQFHVFLTAYLSAVRELSSTAFDKSLETIRALLGGHSNYIELSYSKLPIALGGDLARTFSGFYEGFRAVIPGRPLLEELALVL